MENSSRLEIGYLSLNKNGEELCGDRIKVSKKKDGTVTFVLADGIGSGVTANILSTLTSTMLATMINNNISIEEAVKTIIQTLPVAKDRGNVAYSTFSVVSIFPDYTFEIINYDNPRPIFLRDGIEVPLIWCEIEIEGKKIYKARNALEDYDEIILISDGVEYAGVGETLNFGWGRKDIVEYTEGFYNRDISAKNTATILLEHCNVLYNNRPGDDTTCAVIRRRPKNKINVMVGSPTEKEDDTKMLELFFNSEGKHIVCGGTSSNVAARYLNKPVFTTLDYIDPKIPPIGHIDGVDLVTEGVITLNALVELSKDHIGQNDLYFEWSYKEDGASLLARYLFEEATDIHFYLGCAVNPSHQDPKLNISISTKMGLVNALCENLKIMGKHVDIDYF